MATPPANAERTAHLLALMKKGDDAFNARDFAGMKAVHHVEMTAQIMGSPQPIRGQAAHAEAMIGTFPDVHVDNDPYAIQFGNGDWVTVITRTRGTFTGQMALPGGKVIAPTKRRSTSTSPRPPGWDGDLLIEEFVFWNSALQAQQLGIG